MTTSYLKEIEITRALNLPDRVGKIKMAMWKMIPSFPAPEPGTAGRRYFPAVVKWLNSYHHVDSGTIETSSGGDGRENFDEWRAKRAARKARKTGKSGHAGPDLPPAQNGMGNAVVTTFRPRGAGLSQDDVPAVAAE